MMAEIMPLPISLKQDFSNWIIGFYQHVRRNEERYHHLHQYMSHRLPPAANFREVSEFLVNIKATSFWHADLKTELIRATNQFVEEAYQVSAKIKSNYADMNEYFENGYCVLPRLNADKIAAMRNYFSERPLMTEDQKSLESLEQAKAKGRNVAEFPSGTLLRSPHYLEFISEPAVLERITEYLGAIPTAIIATAWWSFAGREVPKEAQLYHFDDADWKFCNYFIYLTDVQEDSGPHAFMAGTHRSEFVKQQLERVGEDGAVRKALSWYMEQMRKTDEEVSRYFGVAPTIFTGAAGTHFLADTRAIHKGIVPTKKDRLICQITFALAPAIQQDLDSIPVATLRDEFPTIASRFSRAPNNYIFRYLVTPAGMQ